MRLGVVAASMLALGMWTVARADGPGKQGRGKGQAEPEAQAVSNSQIAQCISVLHQTNQMLKGADHDYGGRRVAAMARIAAASHQLKLALEYEHQHENKQATGSGKGQGRPGKGVKAPGGVTGTRTPVVTGGAAANGGQPEAQALSNSQLGQAIQTLVATRAMLKGADHDYGGHRMKAIKVMGEAVKELKHALVFEKKRGPAAN
jgi:hypothetical protein